MKFCIVKQKAFLWDVTARSLTATYNVSKTSATSVFR